MSSTDSVNPESEPDKGLGVMIGLYKTADKMTS